VTIKRIRYVYTGWPGCAHDARVYGNSALARRPERFFSGEEYLLADSGYTPSLRIVPAFKKPPHRSLSPEETQFNFRLSNIRIRVEHCIGILKGRFQSLKGLRLAIRGERDIKRMGCWILTYCVLHNLILQDEFDSERAEDEGDEGRDVSEGYHSGPSSRT
jgi:DDE superfamily endonuclease